MGLFGSQHAYLDRGPSGAPNFLPVEGGSIHMQIDSTSSLDSLMASLSGDWELIETAMERRR